MANAIVTAEKIRYPCASDGALNCEKLAFARHEKSRLKGTSYGCLYCANVQNTGLNSSDNAKSRTSLAFLQFSKRNRIHDNVFMQPTSGLHAKKK